MFINHRVSECCEGEKCRICGDPATHKVGEEVLFDDPFPVKHNYTAYVCCDCFMMIFGPSISCLKSSRIIIEGKKK